MNLYTVTTYGCREYLHHTGHINAGVLERHPRRVRVSIVTIQRMVAERFHIPASEMTSPRRPRFVARPRQVAMYLSMGDLEHEHARQTELALFYPGPEHDFPKGRPTDMIRAPRTGNEFHPTEKPVQLMRAVAEWTRAPFLTRLWGQEARAALLWPLAALSSVSNYTSLISTLRAIGSSRPNANAICSWERLHELLILAKTQLF